MKKLRLFLLAVLLLIALTVGLTYGSVSASLHGANGYACKWVCSEIFVTGLDPEQAVANLPDNPLIPLLRHEVDREQGLVTLSALGLFPRSAVFRQGFGCTSIPPGKDATDLTPVPDLAPVPDLEIMGPSSTVGTRLGSEPVEREPGPSDVVEAEATEADSAEAGAVQAGPLLDQDALDQDALDQAIADAFDEPNPDLLKRTRAVLVVQHGEIVAERYADGIDVDTQLPGWSMTKSWINTLVGLAVHRGLVDIHKPLELDEWPEGDARRAITLDQLLRMSSGLEFVEDYADLDGDAVQMLFVGEDTGAFALHKPLGHLPDAHWYYSSGTTNLIARALRDAFPSTEHYLRFPQQAFFEPVGMTGALIEPDPSGTLVGSSFGWATARDWARFGLLYLQDGVWNGERLLPEGWVEYTATPTPKAPQGHYGAQFWLNAGEPDDPADRSMPRVPADLLMASGFSGQHVIVAPSKNAVIVRLGLSYKPSTWDLETFLAPILDALPDA